MIVIDSSAIVRVYTDHGPVGDTVRTQIEEAKTLFAPYLLDIEVASALMGMARGVRGGKPKLTKDALDKALRAYTKLPLRRIKHLSLFPRMRELSTNLSIYDATYVALAEIYRVPLVTSDGRIERSKVARCEIRTFNDPITAS